VPQIPISDKSIFISWTSKSFNKNSWIVSTHFNAKCQKTPTFDEITDFAEEQEMGENCDCQTNISLG